MKRTLTFTLLTFFSMLFTASAQSYKVDVDLLRIRKDRVKVTVRPPVVNEDTALYVMPSIVPGTYARYDFGRFITGFRAFDSTNKQLPARVTEEYFYKIPATKGISRIEYYVNDTWDTEDSLNFVFQPGGSNIEKGKDVVINTHAFIGYLDGHSMKPYEVTITKPASFYGATALEKTKSEKTRDVYFSPNYNKLADHPMLYSKPDTSTFTSGDAKITVSVYSPRGIVKADSIAQFVKPLAASLTNFFGKLPVDHYNFLVYLKDLKSITPSHRGGFGALEHSYSSLYYLPELNDNQDLKNMLMGVMSHEFLHILTPLNIHSEEIEYFDFKDPKMSAHLWLYEGVTEYFSNLVQVRDSLISYQDFIEAIRSKIRNASEYPDVSFTEMSRNILEKEYKPMYQNVYEKGALIGFLLDIRLHELSKGESGLRELMMKLKEKYGPSRPFKDDQLVNEIVSMTYPEIRNFFDSCVVGSVPLPYESYFKKIGWNYIESKPDVINSFGQVGFMYDEKEKVFRVVDTRADMNVFGLDNNDILLNVNGEKVEMDNYVRLLTPLVEVKDLSSVTIEFRHDGKVEKRTASPIALEVSMQNILEEDPKASPEAITLRKKMLNR